MQIRRYEVESLKAAHHLIRRDMGAEAVILSTREITVKGKKLLAVLAARDLPEEEGGFYEKNQSAGGRDQAEFPSGLREDLEEIKAKLTWLGKLSERTLTHAEKPCPCRPCRDREEEVNPPSLRGFLTEILAPSGLDRPWLEELYALMYSESQGKDYPDLAAVRDELRPLLSAELQEAMRQPREGRVKIYVGPTGTGKTTTLVKLAARYSWEKKLKVGLITADTYRIAAQEQLRIYASIMGFPLALARNAPDFRKALGEFSSLDLILVDTPGRNPRHREELGLMQTLFADVGDAEINLVLSATSSLENLFQATEGYGIIGIDNVIFTKLDECGRFGFLYDYLRATGNAVSYLTDGQKVPEDIVPASAQRLAGMICDGKLH